MLDRLPTLELLADVRDFIRAIGGSSSVTDCPSISSALYPESRSAPAFQLTAVLDRSEDEQPE